MHYDARREKGGEYPLFDLLSAPPGSHVEIETTKLQWKQINAHLLI